VSFWYTSQSLYASSLMLAHIFVYLSMSTLALHLAMKGHTMGLSQLTLLRFSLKRGLEVAT